MLLKRPRHMNRFACSIKNTINVIFFLKCRYLADRANLLLFVDSPRTGKQLLSLQESQELMVSLEMN